MRRWSNDEIDILKKYYPIEKYEVCKRLVGRNKESVYRKATNLGLIEKFKSNSKVKHINPYTDEEIEIIKKYYPTEGTLVALRLPNHSLRSCLNTAKRLGYSTNKYRKWTKDELEILNKYYPIEGSKCYLRLKGRSVESVYGKAIAMGIKTTANTTKLRKNRNNFTNEEIEIIRKYYSTEGNKIIKRLPNHSMTSIYGKVRSLGLSKEELNSWTDDELNILKEYYPIEGNESFKRIPNHTEKECISKLCHLKLNIGNYTWKEEEIEIIKKYYPREGTKVIKRLNGRTKYAIHKIAHLYNIKYEGSVDWSTEEDKIMFEYYSIEGGSVIHRLNNKTREDVYVRARKLGIKIRKDQ